MIASLVAAAALGVAAPPSQKVCTAVGCASGIAVDLRRVRSRLPRAVRATVCLEARCIPVREFREPALRDPSLSGPGPVRVRVVVYDREDRRLLRVERRVRLVMSQPNGPSCPPTCWWRGLRLDVAGGARLVVAS